MIPIHTTQIQQLVTSGRVRYFARLDVRSGHQGTLDEIAFALAHHKVVYLRSGPALFLGSSREHEVVGAVRAVKAWACSRKAHLEGVSPDQRPKTLVRDVRTMPITYLGETISYAAAHA